MACFCSFVHLCFEMLQAIVCSFLILQVQALLSLVIYRHESILNFAYLHICLFRCIYRRGRACEDVANGAFFSGNIVVSPQALAAPNAVDLFCLFRCNCSNVVRYLLFALQKGPHFL